MYTVPPTAPGTLAGPRRRFASVTWPIDCGREAEEQKAEGDHDGFGEAPKLRNFKLMIIHWHQCRAGIGSQRQLTHRHSDGCD